MGRRADVWACGRPTYCGAMAADASTGETTELLQTLIRNACVNDGSPDSGFEIAQRRCAPDVPRGRRARRRALRSAPWPRFGGGAHRGFRPVGAVAVPDGPHRRRARQPGGLEARSVRGRTDRRRGVGSGGDRHAQPDLVDGGRLSPPGTIRVPATRRPDLLRGRRRGGGRGVGCGVDVRAPSRRDRCRLLRDRAGRLVDGRRTRAAPRHGQRRREGHGVAQAPRARHARPRLDAVRR